MQYINLKVKVKDSINNTNKSFNYKKKFTVCQVLKLFQLQMNLLKVMLLKVEYFLKYR